MQVCPINYLTIKIRGWKRSIVSIDAVVIIGALISFICGNILHKRPLNQEHRIHKLLYKGSVVF